MRDSYGFQIDGMSCAGCVARVDRVLARVAGGGSANLVAAAVRVPAGAVAHEVAEALDAAGFPARREDMTLEVEGMTCASCVSRVEGRLGALPGVLSARVNLADGTVRVRVLAGAQGGDDLAKALADMGYPAVLRGDDGPGVDRQAEEIARARGRFLWAGALTLPVVVLEMGGHLVPAFHHWLHGLVGMQAVWVVQAVLTALVLAGPGRGFFRHGVPGLLKGSPDMNALVLLGAGSAFVYSLLVLVAPALLPEAARAVWFEAAAVIVTLILAGRWMEARAKGQAGAAIRGLMALAPPVARVERGGAVIEVPVAEVRVGDLLHLAPGARVAVDGVVTAGTSHVDESMLTGEPVPVAKGAGDTVTAGCVNGLGSLTFRATGVGADTMLARIARMVEEAQGARLPVQDMVNRVTAWFVPMVLVVAVVTVAAWLVFGPEPVLPHALVAGVSVLIVACPCAMGLAVPVSIMVGTGRAAALGVLFRKGEALQGLAEARVVAFDKTGTLTEGRPAVTEIVVAEGVARDEVLRLAAAVEAGSEHPISRAVVAEAGLRGLAVPAVEGFRAEPGYGVSGLVEGRRVAVGALRMLVRDGVATGALEAEGERLAGLGRTAFFVVAEGVAVALIAVSDPVKQGAAEALAALRAGGREVAMVTGDAEATAQAVAKVLGIQQVIAGVLPGGKVEAVRALQAGGKVAFVGDGINDAPALAAADTGVAVGTGTDVAIAAADVVLMRGDLAGVATALRLSEAVMRNIRQNLVWAFGYNAALIPVAAGVLYPVMGVQISPMLAAGAMAASSLCVIANALRLRYIQPVREARA
ncbi:MAG: heavy metal translocating P-type ATPase [Gemmobacter sp.]